MTFYVQVKLLKKFFFLLRKRFKKEKYNSKSFSKSYSLRFIDSTRFMNASLDSHVNYLTDINYSKKCKNCIKCKVCKKREKINEDCKCYLKYVKVINNNIYWSFLSLLQLLQDLERFVLLFRCKVLWIHCFLGKS